MIKKIKTRNKKIKIGRTRKMKGGWQCSYSYPVCDLEDGWCYNNDKDERSSEDINGRNHSFWWDESCSENNKKHEKEAAQLEREREAEQREREREAAQREAEQREAEQRKAAQQEREREAARHKEKRDKIINNTITKINMSYVKHEPPSDIIESCINEFKRNIRGNITQYTNDCIKKNFRHNCVLGEGSFGKVIFYKCDENNYIAFKIHTGNNIKETEAMAIQEISILKTLKSLYNVINLYDNFYTTTRWYVISYEAINGYNLNKYISDYNDTKYRNEILYQLIYTMLDIHKHNILHLDIKPDNIMIDITKKPHRAVYIDFGLSVQVPENKFKIIDGIPDDNFIYNAQGTFDYMAPSIIKNFDIPTGKTKYNGLVDLWALGITIAYMYMKDFDYKITSRIFYLKQIENGEVGKIVNKNMNNIFAYQSDNDIYKLKEYFPDNTFWNNFINYDKFKDLYLNLNENYKGPLLFENIPSPPAAWSNITIGNPINAINKKGVLGAFKGLKRLLTGGKYRKSFKRKKTKKKSKKRNNKKK